MTAMSNKLIRTSVNLRSAKARLQEAEQLIATMNDTNAKNDIGEILSHIDKIIEKIDRKSGMNPTERSAPL